MFFLTLCLYWVFLGTVYPMEWSLGEELWSGVFELSGIVRNFGVAKILITPADSVYLTFLISGLVFLKP